MPRSAITLLGCHGTGLLINPGAIGINGFHGRLHLGLELLEVDSPHCARGVGSFTVLVCALSLEASPPGIGELSPRRVEKFQQLFLARFCFG